MQRVSMLQLEDLGNFLLQLPELFDRCEQGCSGFPDKVIIWLKEVEGILKKANILSAASVAALRGEMLIGNTGIMPSDICPQGSRPKRKHRNALAVRILKDAELCIRQSIASDSNRLSEAAQIAYQIVVLGLKKGVLHQQDLPVSEMTWGKLELDADIVSLLVHMQAVVGKRDSKLLLTRSLSVCLSE